MHAPVLHPAAAAASLPAHLKAPPAPAAALPPPAMMEESEPARQVRLLIAHFEAEKAQRLQAEREEAQAKERQERERVERERERERDRERLERERIEREIMEADRQERERQERLRQEAERAERDSLSQEVVALLRAGVRPSHIGALAQPQPPVHAAPGGGGWRSVKVTSTREQLPLLPTPAHSSPAVSPFPRPAVSSEHLQHELLAAPGFPLHPGPAGFPSQSPVSPQRGAVAAAAGAVGGAAQSDKICVFFNGPRGCRLGDRCDRAHIRLSEGDRVQSREAMMKTEVGHRADDGMPSLIK